jgi:hypothetical protein
MAFGSNERLKTCVHIMSPHLRGFNKDKYEAIILRMVQRNLWAATPQETWRIGDTTWENGGLTFNHHGLNNGASFSTAPHDAFIFFYKKKNTFFRRLFLG